MPVTSDFYQPPSMQGARLAAVLLGVRWARPAPAAVPVRCTQAAPRLPAEHAEARGARHTQQPPTLRVQAQARASTRLRQQSGQALACKEHACAADDIACAAADAGSASRLLRQAPRRRAWVAHLHARSAVRKSSTACSAPASARAAPAAAGSSRQAPRARSTAASCASRASATSRAPCRARRGP